MEDIVSLQDVANIVTFIAPGYFAIQVYSLIYAKKDRDFPRLLIESVVYSLPIITLVNVIWQNFLGHEIVTSLNIGYAILMLTTAFIVGLLATIFRTRWPIKHFTSKIGWPSPDEDFVKTQLLRVDVTNPKKSAVTVKLKSGAIFSGTVDRLSRYVHGGAMYYYFANLAWFNEVTEEWEEREGGIIVRRDEVEYIQTPSLLDKS